MEAFEQFLRDRGIPGYRVFASSYHAKGVSFYRRLGLEGLGEFQWRLHDGTGWRVVMEQVFVKALVSP